MPDRSYLDWPFFADRHRLLADAIDRWSASHLPVDHGDVDAACRDLVARLGRDGWLLHSAVDPDAPGLLDVRTLCLIRETLARHDGLADFAFAMQGLGAGAISLFGTVEQRGWLRRTRTGAAIAAFALSEPKSGSDVANMEMTASKDGDAYVLDGEKTWISNGGIADFYVVFARTGEAPGAKGISAFIVPADLSGLSVAERLDVIAPHPLARLRFERARVPASAMIGEAGQGFRIAMAVLDVFRSTVGAAALGFARRALDEAVKRARERRLFGAPLAELQMVQGHIADMAVDVDAAALLVYRAAWTKDKGAARVTREAAMAKLFATERAQEVIDRAVQLHGGDGVRRGHIVESLYREIRALRIYEGASDVQKVVIARQVLEHDPEKWRPVFAKDHAPNTG
ncbi:MAG: acyl-CoA dehydrogenase family protein [Xanthobacteraceae bacterium]